MVLVHALAGRAVDEEARSALPLERNKPRGLETIAWDVEQLISALVSRRCQRSEKSTVAMPRIFAAVVMAFMLALIAAPARSFEAATADDTARFLAGLPLSSNSPLAPYTKDPAWQQHARYFDTIFAHEISAQLSKVREFSKKHLTDQHDTMLYMFSGPDFLYATSFFPNASTYVLAGLEPVGEIADLTGLSPWDINGELRNLELSMGSLFNFSFFITQNMTDATTAYRSPARAHA